MSDITAGGTHTATIDHRRVKTNDHAVAAGHSVARWQEAFEGLIGRIAARFARVEPRRRVRQLVLGLLSDLPRKNCWTIAEWAGEATPHGMVRRYASWARWVTLAMLAHAFLAIVRADEHAHHPASDARIPLTCNEIQHLFIALVVRLALDAVHRLDWSDWRRRHQARSQTSHYRRQAAQA